MQHAFPSPTLACPTAHHLELLPSLVIAGAKRCVIGIHGEESQVVYIVSVKVSVVRVIGYASPKFDGRQELVEEIWHMLISHMHFPAFS